ncbi:MAG: permease [Saprospiraceae bacterium]|nr:MAG: permease [Saprospiraceae bacterium]
MAWRDTRRNRSRLLLFISSIIVGIAALVAINSFGENLQKDINREARTLLGADLQLESTQPTTDSLEMILDSLGGEQAASVNFVSMVYFPISGATRLAYVRAMEGGFPFYGKVLTEPVSAYQTFKSGKQALVDKTMMLQFNLQVGDSIKIGQVSFVIAGQLNSSPGRAGISSSVAPLVMISRDWLEATGLVQRGSRIEYQYFYKLPGDFDTDKWVEDHELTLKAADTRAETVGDRKRSLSNAFSNLNTFLNLVGFIALLLGCIGVASAVNIYIKDKLSTVAVLRCLGASGRQAFLIYLLQISAMGLVGALLGALIGSLLQLALPLVLGDFLPVSNVSSGVSWVAIVQGILTGLGIAILFALLPLLGIRQISPLSALRAEVDGAPKKRDPWRWLVYFLIFLLIVGFTYFQTGGGIEAILFPIGLGGAFLLLAGIAQLIRWSVRRFFPSSWSYIWRQSLANLYRPNNQTLILMVSIGLGTALLTTLFFTRDLLLDQVRISGSGDRPNMILFDIQSSQKEGVAKLTKANQLPIIQQVPIVTMRMETIDGIDKVTHLKDTTTEVRDWVYNREYRVTYRDTLIDSETVIKGEWHGDKPDDGTIYISIADNIAKSMKAEPGTRLVFNVQGTPIEAVVSSIREVDFNRVQTNFMVVFPTGVLEKAPQFHVVVTRTESETQSAKFQRSLVQQFPNVSVIDLTQILKSVDEVLGKVSFVIRFMAFFSILTGILVLISSVSLSKYQRIQESVLLRTIGASRRQILWINALEYLLLGSLASFTGLLLAVAGTWLLAYFQLGIPFTPNLWPALLTFALVTGLTVLIGLFNSREVVNLPPLEVLRKEV